MPTNFDKVEFDSSNPEPRCPCVLLLDTSGSMASLPIDQLNEGLQAFKEALCKDDLASIRVELMIISFGDSARIVQDFISPLQFMPPMLSANGSTPMGAAINMGLDQIEDRKKIYRQNGVPYYRPWMFLITDGAPTDDVVNAAQRVTNAESGKKLAFFAVGVRDADINTLSKISVRKPVLLDGLKFGNMFQWLSTSLTQVSRSKPGMEVPLQSPAGWATV